MVIVSFALLFLPLVTLGATVLQPHSGVALNGSGGKLWATWAIKNLEKKIRKFVTRMSGESYVYG